MLYYLDTMNSHREHPRLGQAAATAICGNDILSSALYVSGIAVLFAGVYAPLVLLGIGFVLFLYKKVYTEVVEALPVNGGAYNCLLNGTSKTTASAAGVMTLLSYVATAVISAKVGVEYLNIGLEQASKALGHSFTLPILPCTVGVLLIFALLVISGVKDSAKVALGIFALHIVTLTLFLVLGAVSFFSGHASHFAENFARTGGLLADHGGLLGTLVLAFSASLLGVSGFESSANFVEEQAPGVFRKTLRNMLIGVVIFNPLIALVVLSAMPYDAIVHAKDFLLADAARAIGGTWFTYLMSADAFLVLCGAVLTAYVGVSGLLSRMTADNCFPSVFARESNRGSFPRIVIAFFLLCSSILLVTRGDLLSLAGVYTIAFLGVMSLFALGNLILREGRRELKRTYRAPLLAVFIALLATTLGIVGNIRIDPDNIVFFAMYFIPTLALVFAVIHLDFLLRVLLRITRRIPVVHNYLTQHFEYITEGRFVAFIHHVKRLQPILDYINRNETGCDITLVHCRGPEDDLQPCCKEIAEALPFLKKSGFFPHFQIRVLFKNIQFSPEAIDQVAAELHIPRNRIFIGSIHAFHDFDYADLGGVRIIFG